MKLLLIGCDILDKISLHLMHMKTNNIFVSKLNGDIPVTR